MIQEPRPGISHAVYRYRHWTSSIQSSLFLVDFLPRLVNTPPQPIITAALSCLATRRVRTANGCA